VWHFLCFDPAAAMFFFYCWLYYKAKSKKAILKGKSGKNPVFSEIFNSLN
jgi:hypothetical protein